MYHAHAIRRRASRAATEDLQLNAFSIGGVGFITTTYEMFTQNGQFIKENAPFDTTFIITGQNVYLPTPDAYDFQSYEAATGMYVKGTAEKLAEELVQMLNTVK